MTTRRRYLEPPVHEVVLDLQFQDEVDRQLLEALENPLGEQIAPRSPIGTFSLEGGFGATGPSGVRSTFEYQGWEFRSEDSEWIVRAQADQLTLHAMRSAVWPAGDYIGWESIQAQFRNLHQRITPIYNTVDVRRAGLRYVNRIALEEGVDLEKLFNIVPPAPEGVRGLYRFAIHHSWAEIEDHDHLSASLRFGRIDLPDEDFLEDAAAGVLLDIDVFNLYVTNAPAWGAVPAWFAEAHGVENALFERSITDELRARFKLEEDGE